MIVVVGRLGPDQEVHDLYTIGADPPMKRWVTETHMPPGQQNNGNGQGFTIFVSQGSDPVTHLVDIFEIPSVPQGKKGSTPRKPDKEQKLRSVMLTSASAGFLASLDRLDRDLESPNRAQFECRVQDLEGESYPGTIYFQALFA